MMSQTPFIPLLILVTQKPHLCVRDVLSWKIECDLHFPTHETLEGTGWRVQLSGTLSAFSGSYMFNAGCLSGFPERTGRYAQKEGKAIVSNVPYRDFQKDCKDNTFYIDPVFSYALRNRSFVMRQHPSSRKNSPTHPVWRGSDGAIAALF